jgi:hypothetical protein
MEIGIRSPIKEKEGDRIGKKKLPDLHDVLTKSLPAQQEASEQNLLVTGILH